ncbi:something about silencing, SAS, complex subunit 4-domain-containing protein [Lipomyces chichibuensis]|uniref:something about silencing, SAS, complex subunit 4-domain-containing protein n=1 Tax=Lipomyces chichibuensis TaxID=1546026 RepID=UPI00334300BE
MPSIETTAACILGSSSPSPHSTSSLRDRKAKENNNKNDKRSKFPMKRPAEEAGVAHDRIPSVDEPSLSTAKEEDTKRQLRSERSRLRSGINGAIHAVECDEEDLLWFENLDTSPVVDYDEELQITDDPFPTIQELTPVRRPSPFPVSSIVNPISAESQARLYDTPVKIRSRSDPLCDSMFVGHHKRGEREERHYQNFERDKVMYEKLRFERQLDRLKGRDWVKAVVSMTPVKDPKCVHELITKRDKLIHELVNVLAKFESWKEREKKIKSLNGDEDELMSSMRLRLEERKKELKNLHHIIPKVGNGRARKGVGRNQQGKETTITRSEAQARRELDSDQRNPSSVLKNLKSTANAKLLKTSAFGYPLPRIRYRQFHIPLDWVENREKLRQTNE